MNEVTVRTVLRLVAVVTILVGTIMLAMSLVASVGTRQAIRGAMMEMGGNLTGVAAELGFVSLLSQTVIIAVGLLLYVLSPSLARKIVD